MHIEHHADEPAAEAITFGDFLKIDVRIGRIVKVEEFPEARKPAYKLTIDFGAIIGTRKSSAQITENYDPVGLMGKLVAAVVNFPPRQIGKFMSEVLTVGFPDQDGKVVLFSPDKDVSPGARLF